MLIGILSDTHGRAQMTAAAVALLRERGAEFFVHCGDIGGEEVLDQLAGLPSVVVFGNTDWDRDDLARYAGTLGIGIGDPYAELELAGRRIAVLHGDDHALLQSLLTAQQHDYLFHGHTHVRNDQRVGRTRVINPGALHRARRKSVATLDLATDALTFLDLLEPDKD